MNKPMCVAVMAFTCAGAAFAGPGQKPMESKAPSFEELDTNDNGSISRSEAKAYPELEKIFSTADSDKNGELMANEYRAAKRKLKS
jgi:Ca2+-binding EF-hand superfamily protein